jgi:hypothetical protein
MNYIHEFETRFHNHRHERYWPNLAFGLRWLDGHLSNAGVSDTSADAVALMSRLSRQSHPRNLLM